MTKFDLLKRFWQIPFTDRPKEILEFVTTERLFRNKLKALKCCLVHLVHRLIFGLDGCKAYIDDAIIYSEEWDHQIILQKTQ